MTSALNSRCRFCESTVTSLQIEEAKGVMLNKITKRLRDEARLTASYLSGEMPVGEEEWMKEYIEEGEPNWYRDWYAKEHAKEYRHYSDLLHWAVNWLTC